MHPVLRRILLHGGLTALVLALIGAMFAELANIWLVGNVTRGTAADANDQVGSALRARVPLTLAAWGFVFVLVGELVIWRVRGSRKPAPKPLESQDDAEKLLNELLAQAEAKMAAESSEQGSGDRGQEEQKPAEPPTA